MCYHEAYGENNVKPSKTCKVINSMLNNKNSSNLNLI